MIDKRVVYPAILLTGMTALVDELVWTRWLGLLLGNFVTAAGLVLMTFMAGLAAGSVLLGRLASRRSPAGALRLYARLELGVAACAALSPLLLASGSPLAGAMAAVERLPGAGPVLCAALLLPPTVLMGGTLPALARALGASTSGGFGAVYAWNTVGAGCGPLVAAFGLLPWLGYSRTILACAGVNALAAMWVLRAGVASAEPEPESPPLPEEPMHAARWHPGLVFGFIAGFCSLAFEVALTRQTILIFTGASVYGFALVLSAFLFGIALGATLVRHWPPADGAGGLRAFGLALGVVWLAAMLTPLWIEVALLVFPFWASLPAFGPLQGANFGVIMVLLLGFAVPFGCALPALVSTLRRTDAAGIGVLLAVNTAGAVAGAWAATFVGLPHAGLHGTLAALGAVALLAGGSALWIGAPPWRPLTGVVTVLGVLGAFVLPAPPASLMSAGLYYRPADLKPAPFAAPQPLGERILEKIGTVLYQADSYTGRIVVRENSGGAMVFVANGKPDSSNGFVDGRTMCLSGELALLHHPRPRSALVVGLGAGLTLGAMLGHPLDHLTCLELDPAVERVAREFSRFNGNALADPRVRLVFEDGRHYLARTVERFDVMLVEPTNLFIAGMVNLYTREFYRLAASRLAPDGVYCQWLQLYDLRWDDLLGVIRTARAVFPNLAVWTDRSGNLFLIAVQGSGGVEPARWRRVLEPIHIRIDLNRLQIEDPMDIVSLFIMGPGDVARLCGPGPILTDDLPFIEYSAPKTWNDRRHVDRNNQALSRFPLQEPVALIAGSPADRLDCARRFARAGQYLRARLECGTLLADPEGSAAVRAGAKQLLGSLPPPAPLL